MYQETTALKKIQKLKKRIRIIQGGTSASKTISILLYLIAYAQTDKEPTVTSIVSESIPHLKRGVIRDFKKILQAHKYWNDVNWNETDKIYTFETGSKIEFFSTDNGDKLRGARRHRLFINEANNVTFEAFNQLEIRTFDFIILDFNPVEEFWAHTELISKRDDVDFIVLTYLDNESLPKEMIKAIEVRKDNNMWWRVYGLGLTGQLDSRVYSGWVILDTVPEEAKLIRRGLDYGYTNDPSAIVDVYEYNNGILLDELLYQKGLSNKKIADFLLNQPIQSTLIVADSAEPKSNDELRIYGLSVLESKKNNHSVSYGIQLVQEQKIYVTKRSINLLKEYRGYLWIKDSNGKILNTPDDRCANHLLDASRYAIETIRSIQQKPSEIDIYLYSNTRNRQKIDSAR